MKKAEEQRRTKESEGREQQGAMKTQAEVLYKQALTLKVIEDAKAIGDITAIKEFEAITKRLKQSADTLHDIIEGSNAERDRQTIREPEGS